MDTTNLESLTLNKGGENQLFLNIGRSPRHPEGIVISVKALPQIEAFMRNLATPEGLEVGDIGPDGNPVGEPQPIIRDSLTEGRGWLSTDKDNPLRLYGISRVINPVNGIRIDRGCQPLVDSRNEPPREDRYGDAPNTSASNKYPSGWYANLSFLRLVGISEGAGVSFVVRGVYSDQQVKDIHAVLLDGVRRFWTAYLKPMNMCIQVSTQETT